MPFDVLRTMSQKLSGGSTGWLNSAIFESGIVQICTLVAGLAILSLRVTVLGVESFGDLAVALAAANILAATLSFGLPRAIGYYVAKDAITPKNVLIVSLSTYGLTASLLAFGSVMLPVNFGPSVPVWRSTGVIVTLCLYPVVALRGVLQAFYLAALSVRSVSVASVVEVLVLMLLTGVAVGVGLKSVPAHLCIFGLSVVVGLTAGAFSAGIQGVWRHKEGVAHVDLRQILRYGLSQNGIAFVLAIQSRMDLFCVRAFLGEHAAGLYAVAAGIAEKGAVVVQTFSTVYLPYLTRQYQKTEEAGVSVLKISAMMGGVTLAVCCSYVVAVQVWATIVQNQVVGAALPLMWWMCVGVTMRAMSRVINVDYHARGDLAAVWLRALGLLLFTGVGVGFGVATGSVYGVATGVAVALAADTGCVMWLRAGVLSRWQAGEKNQLHSPRDKTPQVSHRLAG